jgi:hypothetical protein
MGTVECRLAEWAQEALLLAGTISSNLVTLAAFRSA